ncbi:MAG: DUF1624 domain-containing protein [Alphaproteobacteria bacterium]|nr:DUF1624 domain-containing protein [Alphaproteobacteria bacterium]
MQPARVLSLDVFRGLTICVMIIVNTMGAGATPYWFLVHADWIGFTLADLVFPSFLFVMGNALAFVLQKPMSERAFFAKIFRRSVILFLLGFLMYWYPFVHLNADLSFALNPISQTRIMGVLQRIALCYALAALCARYLNLKQIVFVSAVLLIGYWGLLLWGAPPGLAFSKAHNFGSMIDTLVLGPSHLWRWDDGFEPEGLLGTLPATVNVLAGFVVGRYLLQSSASDRKVFHTAFWGVILIVAGIVLDHWFPISKKLWTGSFVLLTTGLDLVLLSALIWLLDVKKITVGVGFFDIFGKNPLVIYLFSELLLPTLALLTVFTRVDPYQWIGVELFQRLAPGALGSLLCAVAYMLLCWGFGYVLYRKRIFIRL